MTMSNTSSGRHGNERFDTEALAWDNNPDVHIASSAALIALQKAFPALQPPRYLPAAPLIPNPGRSASISAQPPDDFLPTHRPSQSADGVPQYNILEIGCGTGLLTIPLSAHANSVTAVDASPGMIAVLERKLERTSGQEAARNEGAVDEQGVTDEVAVIEDGERLRPGGNVRPLCLMLEDAEDHRLPPAEPYSGKAGGRLKFDLVISHLMLHHIADEDVDSLLKTMLECCVPGDGEIAVTDFEDVSEKSRRFHPEGKMGGVMRHGINRDWARRKVEAAGFVDVSVEEGFKIEKDVERFSGEWGQQRPPPDQCEKQDFPFLLIRGRRPAD